MRSREIKAERQADDSFLIEYGQKIYRAKDQDAMIEKMKELYEREREQDERLSVGHP